MLDRRRVTIGSTLRAAALLGLAVAAAVAVWRLRPGTSTGSTAPDADIVLGCRWLAWVLGGYLAVAVAATAAAHLAAGFGVAGPSLARIAPHRLRRLIDAAITLSVAATIAATAAPAGASTGSALDWPGLTTPPPTVTSATAPTAPVHHPAARQSRDVVVVRAGDTLWSIAARHLGPGASGTSITAAWHAWYAANHTVIGPNPSLIHPGQRLLVPADTTPATDR
jgi:nucleoid-associated protein YgaU